MIVGPAGGRNLLVDREAQQRMQERQRLGREDPRREQLIGRGHSRGWLEPRELTRLAQGRVLEDRHSLRERRASGPSRSNLPSTTRRTDSGLACSTRAALASVAATCSPASSVSSSPSRNGLPPLARAQAPQNSGSAPAEALAHELRDTASAQDGWRQIVVSAELRSAGSGSSAALDSSLRTVSASSTGSSWQRAAR